MFLLLSENWFYDLWWSEWSLNNYYYSIDLYNIYFTMDFVWYLLKWSNEKFFMLNIFKEMLGFFFTETEFLGKRTLFSKILNLNKDRERKIIKLLWWMKMTRYFFNKPAESNIRAMPSRNMIFFRRINIHISLSIMQ